MIAGASRERLGGAKDSGVLEIEDEAERDRTLMSTGGSPVTDTFQVSLTYLYIIRAGDTTPSQDNDRFPMTYDIGTEMSCRDKCQRLSPQRLKIIMKQTYNTHKNASKYNKMIQSAYSLFNKKELRLDVNEWIETTSRDDDSSCFILTVVQRPGAREQQMLPQEFKSLKAACMDSTRLISEVISECGAKSITTEIRNDRFYVTTDNNVKITMVLD